MTIQVQQVSFFRLPMQTRFPFRYGIASLTHLPHLIVKADVEIDGTLVRGFSSDGLAPKWFTKNPDTTFEQDDLPAMLSVIRHAAESAVDVGCRSSFFDWWKAIYDAQTTWAFQESQPPLLAGFGVSLLERAVMDAFCRARQATLHQVLHSNLAEIDLGAVRKTAGGVQPCDILPAQPRASIRMRHTVGLGDPLTASDVNSHNRPQDQLPFTLEENIQRYGLTHFKIKLGGDFEIDHARLLTIAEILGRHDQQRVRFTLDGNENYHNISVFRDHWGRHRSTPTLRSFFDQALLFVEQPLHRDHALLDEVREELESWPDAPEIIIDESDADFSSLPRALELGYSGTSHKNCKGLIKGLANAATITAEQNNGRAAVLSAEDLGNVGPLALTQDLAMAACLNVSHIERNGHHYFAGLSQFPKQEQHRTRQVFAGLYISTSDGFPGLHISDGLLNLNSVNASAFGDTRTPDSTLFERWELC
ncbi:MAG: enolase C-terminal domain-like protein [Planctomycetaceae bacterium]